MHLEGARTQYNKIYFHPDGNAYREDFSKDYDVASIALFLHEMTHIWQWQQKQARLMTKTNKYEYEISDDSDFKKDYGREQQASIVEHAFIAGQNVNKNARYKTTYPFPTYIRVLKEYLPVKTDVKVTVIDWEPEWEKKEEEKKDEDKNDTPKQ